MATLKEFEDALRAAGNTAALDILATLRDRDRATRSIRPARRLIGRKMTPELAAEILHLHQTTEKTQQEIAFELGVNQGRVNEVIKRGKWLDGDPNAPEAVARAKAVDRAKKGVGFDAREPRPASAKAKAPAKETKADAAIGELAQKPEEAKAVEVKPAAPPVETKPVDVPATETIPTDIQPAAKSAKKKKRPATQTQLLLDGF